MYWCNTLEEIRWWEIRHWWWLFCGVLFEIYLVSADRFIMWHFVKMWQVLPWFHSFVWHMFMDGVRMAKYVVVCGTFFTFL